MGLYHRVLSDLVMMYVVNKERGEEGRRRGRKRVTRGERRKENQVVI